jgi:hypothetical protein
MTQPQDAVPEPAALLPVPEFDFGAWLSGARPPTRSVRVIGACHLIGEYEEMDAQLTAMRTPGSTALRPGMFVRGPSEAQIVERMTRLRQEMDASTIDLTFRALTYAEIEIFDEASKGKDGELDATERAARWISASCISHQISEGQAREMRSALGEGQYWACFRAVREASNELPSVPFSLAHSATVVREG